MFPLFFQAAHVLSAELRLPARGADASPFAFFKQVFVEDPPLAPGCGAHGVSSVAFLPDAVLHTGASLDVRRRALLAQAEGFFGCAVSTAGILHEPRHMWLPIGILGHLLTQFVQRWLGEGAYRLRLKVRTCLLTY